MTTKGLDMEQELPPARVTQADAKRAEELLSTSYTGVMNIVAESFDRARQLREVIASQRETSKALEQASADLDGMAGHIGQFKKLVARAEVAEKALELLCRFVAGTDGWESKCDEMLEMARRQLGREKG